MPYENKDISRSWKIEYTGYIPVNNGVVRTMFQITPPNSKAKSKEIIFEEEFVEDHFRISSGLNKILEEKENLFKIWGLIKVEECINEDDLAKEIRINNSDNNLKWAETIEKGHLLPSSQEQGNNIYVFLPERKIGFR